jgi:hypothetical protein
LAISPDIKTARHSRLQAFYVDKARRFIFSTNPAPVGGKKFSVVKYTTLFISFSLLQMVTKELWFYKRVSKGFPGVGVEIFVADFYGPTAQCRGSRSSSR